MVWDTATHVGNSDLPQTLPRGYSIVVPVYRSTTTLPELVSRVSEALSGENWQIILVDDGSPPATWTTVVGLVESIPEVSAIRLGRNAGQHSALLAGIRAARFDTTVTIDDDLQNPPEEILRVAAALSDDVDVVYGSPNRAAQKGWRRGSSFVTRKLMATALGAENAARMSSFRVLRTRLREGFRSDLGPGVSLDALLSWSTSRFRFVDVEHHGRADGDSNYSFRRLLKFAVDTATGYSTMPLQLSLLVGALTALFGLVVLAWVIGGLLVRGSSVPGFPFLASIVAIFAGVQLFTLGIIGEYLARMHFRVMGKPTYVVAEHIGSTEPEA